ncbi:o-methyltransferase family protein [endosymbiont of Acanthamoeba sp. UWC8]|uniref:O-methyltransferase n=1 Tax=endosymbiont of Acanthamoeba sp. UWC8 TaxID=86106 RepID=UPI0004D19559|nr:O-methyltransferase [endosymbiont of Acanthamoeba sp. UWC8]AIF81810.1 o-methyltransferase family protein [endosymbiont of Acanthamoeba sp. UWC8]
MARDFEASAKINYIRTLYAQEDEELIKIRQSAPADKQGIQIGAEEGKLIYIMLKLIKAKNILEIGTCVGYSTLWLARSLQDGGKVISIEKSTEHYNIAKSNLEASSEKDKIELINDDASNIEKYVSGIEFDAVFIDANKQAYPLYSDIAYNLLKSGGLIVADNVFLFGAVYNDEVKSPEKLKIAMQEFNRKISDPEKFESIIIPTREGLSITIKK